MIDFTTKKKIAVIGSLHFPQPMGIAIVYYNIYNQRPKTWLRKFQLIKDQIEKGELDGVIVYMATPLFLQMTIPQYHEAWKVLLSALPKTKSLVIAFEENIHENFDYYDYDEERFIDLDEIDKRIKLYESKFKNLRSEFKLHDREKITIEEDSLSITDFEKQEDNIDSDRILEAKHFQLLKAKERIEDYNNRHEDISVFIEEILNSEIELSTFREKKVIGYRIETFLEEIAKDIFFSVYVPREQLFSEEFAEFIKIFEKYLQQVEGLNFTVDAQASLNGTKFYFKTKDDSIDINKFPLAVKRFNDFIELCTINPDAAMEMLKPKFADPVKALEIIQTFTKKYNRLSIDLKHQQQRLQLMMKQDIENSLVEINIHGTAALMFDNNGLIKDSIGYLAQGTQMPSFVNPKSKYSTEDMKIIEIASMYGDENDVVLVKSNIEILKDYEISLSERQTAVDKVKSFLFKAGKKALKHAEDIGVKVLTAYLENKTKGL